MINPLTWIDEFRGKTLKGIRTQRKHDGPQPCIEIAFEDGSVYLLEGLADTYFEGCYINTLRMAKPIVKVIREVMDVNNREFTNVEINASTFTLFSVRGINDRGGFPFTLTKVES